MVYAVHVTLRYACIQINTNTGRGHKNLYIIFKKYMKVQQAVKDK